MARHPLSSFAALWERHERLYLDIFGAALQKLAKQAVPLNDEDAISEILCLMLNEACYEVAKAREIEVRVPVWEGPIQPVHVDELKGGKKRKRPDFNCKCCNRFADAAEEYEIALHVECKRLGASENTWNLNQNYVKNGISRFDSNTHQYGNRAPSGLMIGYIISMTPETIQGEVNGYQAKLLPAYPPISLELAVNHLFMSRQRLARIFSTPKNFVLTHFWADLQK